jgi:hypothetical protein
MSSAVHDRQGFALPLVILLVALLTVLLTSGLARARTERQIANASDEMSVARTIAQGGLQIYLGATSIRPPDGDSVRVNYIGGYANVVAHLVRRPADTIERSLYVIRSTGVVINPDSGSRGWARHTVAQFAEWETGMMLHRAALTAANGIRRDSGTANVVIWGTDGCGVRPSIPGLRTTTLTGSATPAPDLQGNPGLLTEGVGTGPAIANNTLINWAAVLGAGLVPHYTTFQNANLTYPVQRIAGNLTLSGIRYSSGLLAISGDLSLTGDFFYFEGIILVGGKIQFRADFTMVRGLVVTGLNEQLGISPGRTEIGSYDNGSYIYYDSCKVRSALAPFIGLAPVQNAWMNVWATY